MAVAHFYKTCLPQFSLAEKSFSRIDYKDTYGCQFQSGKNLRVDECVIAFFKSPSPIITSLFTLRNKIMKPLGFKVSDASDRKKLLHQIKIEKGNALGLFKVIDKSNNEVLLGEDDKHLNFRISFILDKNSHQPMNYTFTLSTTVMLNNRFGKLYFVLIRPIHQFIVPSMMKRIIKQLSSN